MSSPSSIIRLLLALLVPPLLITAVLIGDEQYGKVTGGVFWTFHSKGVSIVNPLTCKIEHSFDRDALGQQLPRKWSKGVYMELKSESDQLTDDEIPLTSNPELPPRRDAYILINSGEALKDNALQSEVIVLSTTINKLHPTVARIPVGGGLGNAYAVHNRNQVS